MADRGWKSYYSMGEEYVAYTDRVTDQEVERDGTKFVYSRWKKPYDCDGADYQEMMHYFWGEYRDKTPEEKVTEVPTETPGTCYWQDLFNTSYTSSSYWSGESPCSDGHLVVSGVQCSIWCKLQMHDNIKIESRHGMIGTYGTPRSGLSIICPDTSSTVIMHLFNSMGNKTIYWYFANPYGFDISTNYTALIPSLTTNEIDFKIVRKKKVFSWYYKDVSTSAWTLIKSNDYLTGDRWYMRENLSVYSPLHGNDAWSEDVKIETTCPLVWDNSVDISGPG